MTPLELHQAREKAQGRAGGVSVITAFIAWTIAAWTLGSPDGAATLFWTVAPTVVVFFYMIGKVPN